MHEVREGRCGCEASSERLRSRHPSIGRADIAVGCRRQGGSRKDATTWCSKLLNEKVVALVPGAAFGDDRWVRMSFASADEVIEDALCRIASMQGLA